MDPGVNSWLNRQTKETFLIIKARIEPSVALVNNRNHKQVLVSE